jgi:hypothetical protein
MKNLKPDGPALDANVLDVLEKLAVAVRELFENGDLAYADPGERHVVSELHLLLRPKFPAHIVANEYDRREQETKRLGKSKIVPDLIVHHVGNQDGNLLVVEVKLAGNYNYKSDVRKLAGMTLKGGEYGYAIGAHLVLSVPRRRVSRGHVYINGERDAQFTAWFEAQFA